MLQFLGRLLVRHGDGVAVRYLSKAEADVVWRDGRLLAIDPQGLVFETSAEDGGQLTECLPWGSIGAVRLAGPRPPGAGI